MKRYLMILSLVAVPTVCLAQQQQQPFVPPTMTADDWNQIMESLKPMRFEHGIPIFLRLEEMERRSVEAAQTAARESAQRAGVAAAAEKRAKAAETEKANADKAAADAAAKAAEAEKTAADAAKAAEPK